MTVIINNSLIEINNNNNNLIIITITITITIMIMIIIIIIIIIIIQSIQIPFWTRPDSPSIKGRCPADRESKYKVAPVITRK